MTTITPAHRLFVPPSAAAEVEAMRIRRSELVVEDSNADADRSWAIGNELDSMDARLAELGLDLDVIARQV